MTMRREWTLEAEDKREEGCRVCGKPPELAHITKREYDRPRKPGARTVYVEPESIIPLCPDHHQQYDAHALDIISYLSHDEQVRAVEDMGLIAAFRRVAPVFSRKVGLK